mgnify:CR=1 FL=1
MHRWNVRDGNENDMEGIFSLRNDAFGEMEKDKLDPRLWRWEFMEGPDGKALIYIVDDGGKIVGHFADIPRRFSIHGKEVLGTLSVDLMVHSDYRRRGIFEAMGRYAAQRVKRENGVFMMAYPIRPETIQGLRKIGWKEITELPVLVYPIKFTGIVKRYLHFLLISLLIGGIARFLYDLLFFMRRKGEKEGIEIEKVDQLDNQFEQFCEKALSLYSIMGMRNRNYLTWRYLRHPKRTYNIYRAMEKGKMKGYIVLRKVSLLDFNSAVIVDLLAMGEEALNALLKKGIDHSRREGVDLLGFMVPKLHPYYCLLRRYGFLPSPKAFLFMIYPQEEGQGLLDPKGWYVTWGDTDVI